MPVVLVNFAGTFIRRGQDAFSFRVTKCISFTFIQSRLSVSDGDASPTAAAARKRHTGKINMET